MPSGNLVSTARMRKKSKFLKTSWKQKNLNNQSARYGEDPQDCGAEGVVQRSQHERHGLPKVCEVVFDKSR